MKISLDWLSEHIDISDISTDELANLLTFAGVEVEEIEATLIHENVVVAEVLEQVAHPGADKLSVCKVGHGGQLSQIVCGASNFNVGDKVPLALPGAVLPDGLKIKKGKLRGVASEGMMCSGKELGISPDGSGLLILQKDFKTGTTLQSLYPPDTRLTIEVTPNRPDWLSHLGLAREVAAITSRSLKKNVIVTSTNATRVATDFEIRMDQDAACPFYTARIVRGVRVGDSPDWLRARLESVGLRPINSIVDITNFVLMEMGQPLHAFDLAKVEGGIHVRLAKDGEKLVAFDGKTYELTSADTVIADAKKPLAIAGVMGGEESGVTETTTEILLESAYFHPPSVRRTSHHLAVSSDSSYRFERGVDPQQVLGASELATQLILDLAAGTPEESIQTAGDVPKLVDTINLDHERCCNLLGKHIEDERIVKILSSLGLQAVEQAPRRSSWGIPSYRLDLTRPVDLAEEIARIYGLDNIPSRNLTFTAPSSEEDFTYDLVMQLKQRLVSLGFCETPTLSMVSERQVKEPVIGQQRNPVPIKNPLGSDYKMMRTSLLSGLAVNELASGLLNVACRNANLGSPTARVFEIGPVYSDQGEDAQLSMLIAGDATEVSWMTPRPRSLTIHDMHGIIQALIPGIPLRLELADSDALALASDLNVQLSGNETPLGRFGQCTPRLSRKIGYDAVMVAELRIATLRKCHAKPTKYHEISPYPAITRDVAMEVDIEVTSQAVSEFFRTHKEDLIESYSLFDVFVDPTGEKLDASKKSLAYTLTYRAKNKTLESKVVDKAHAKLLKALQQRLGVAIR